MKSFFQLISDTDSIGDGSGGAESSKVVQEACSYYSKNNDFTNEQFTALRKLYPERSSYKKLEQLCIEYLDNNGEIDIDSEVRSRFTIESLYHDHFA